MLVLVDAFTFAVHVCYYLLPAWMVGFSIVICIDSLELC